MTTEPDLEVLDPAGRPHLVFGTGSRPSGAGTAAAPPRTATSAPSRPTRATGTWDVVVIGGGPAGSVAAGTLAERGRRVLLLEASAYPRARVGESLSPTCLEIVDRIGAGPAVRALGSVPKTGATFLWGPRELPWSVRYQPPGAPAAALHVRRAEFDEILRQAAATRGAEVRRGCAVEDVVFEGGRACGVRLADGGAPVRAAWVVDASGPAAVLGRQLRIVESRPGRTGTAAWSYWIGADRLPDAAGYDSLYVGGPDRCWWYLPVGEEPDLVAVGMWDRQGPPSPVWAEVDRWYHGEVTRTPLVSGLLGGARREWPVQSMPAEPYAATRLAGPGWLIVGDAGGFVDPVLTPGVQLAMEQGVSAARVVDGLLSDRAREAAALNFYHQVSARPTETFRALCDHLYAAASSTDHGRGQPAVLKHAGAAEDGTGRMTFLATISGLAAEQLPAALEAYLGRRTAAAERGGVAPGFGETEGFSFLSRVVHERRLAAEVTSEAEIGEHAFFDPDPEGSLCYRPAVSNRLGDRFRLTPELDRILTGAGADADIAAGWLELLAANGLARSGSLVVAREADD